MSCLRGNIFIRFDRTTAYCDGRADTQTDTQEDTGHSIFLGSIASHGRNSKGDRYDMMDYIKVRPKADV